tara:strand:+ start:307 stop:1095 length:789 start_codon:yes stop_codon:yes gene_type:complete
MLDSYRTQDPFEYSFTCSTIDYLESMFTSVLTYYNGIGSGDFIFNNEIIYRKPLSFKKYQNSEILILGGGPTTKKVLKNTPNIKYDYVWSVNNFYLNKSLPKIDLAVLGKEPNKFDSKLINYIKENKTNIVFEEAKDNRNGEENIQSLFPNQTAWYNTRYQSKLGIGVRIVIFAIMLGIKKISIAGIDGYTIKGDNDHAFEPNKSLPSWGLNEKQTYELMGRQFKIFWEYIKYLQNSYEFEIINLGENYPEINQLSSITKTI